MSKVKTEENQAIPLFDEFIDSASSSKIKSIPKPKLSSQKGTTSKQTNFASTQELLSNYRLAEKNQHISHEFQSFGCHLAEVLADKQHTSLYIKLAKTLPRAILERALSFVIDSKADNKAKLFMWKLQQLKVEQKKSIKL